MVQPWMGVKMGMIYCSGKCCQMVYVIDGVLGSLHSVLVSFIVR
jgi:hypothetical protein